MRSSKWIVIPIACGLITGCRQTSPPLSGGKPLAYWLQTLKSPEPRLRKQAVAKLGNAGPINAQVLPALIEALKDQNSKVRCEAVVALLKMGDRANDALPALAAMRSSDQDTLVRSYASRAMNAICKK